MASRANDAASAPEKTRRAVDCQADVVERIAAGQLLCGPGLPTRDPVSRRVGRPGPSFIQAETSVRIGPAKPD